MFSEKMAQSLQRGNPTRSWRWTKTPRENGRLLLDDGKHKIHSGKHRGQTFFRHLPHTNSCRFELGTLVTKCVLQAAIKKYILLIILHFNAHFQRVVLRFIVLLGHVLKGIRGRRTLICPAVMRGRLKLRNSFRTTWKHNPNRKTPILVLNWTFFKPIQIFQKSPLTSYNGNFFFWKYRSNESPQNQSTEKNDFLL